MKVKRFEASLLVASLVLYEYFKTKGFLGFSYGITAYTQVRNIYFIQIADKFEVYGISFVLSLSSVTIFFMIRDCIEHYHKTIRLFSKITLNLMVALIGTIIFFYIYGYFRIKEGNGDIKLKVIAVQPNSDPWLGGIDHYEEDVDTLISLSKEALSNNEDASFIIWPETSVVPSIIHSYYEENPNDRRSILINKLLSYIDSSSCAFILGNYHKGFFGDFNASYCFIPGKNTIPPEPYIYTKRHLVPFSEYFPYKIQFPFIYKLLMKNNKLWTPGLDYTVFTYKDIKFATPICFEDCFGSELKKFVHNGARVFFVLSNDAWSKSKRCQQQHLDMSIFRAVENHVPVVRSTASGETCIIDSYGRITSRSPSFQKNYVSDYIYIRK